MKKKKILFITATRAEFGKLKSIISTIKKNKKFEVFIAVTGMHLLREYGSTYSEVIKIFGKKIIKFSNQSSKYDLNDILVSTISKLSKIVKKIKPDLIVYHGDRVETLASAIVGSLNHILTAHIEGGELSGTIDDTIRHAVTKLSHLHFVGNKKAYARVIAMGENNDKVFIIGSPDLDILFRNKVTISSTKKRYGIRFRDYSILIWHPVTSEISTLKSSTSKLLNFIKKSKQNFVIIYPNNDPGSKLILNIYRKNINNKKIKFLRSLRFENFISLLKHAKYIIGNSSSAIYEAPPLKTPSINIGTRQNNRIKSKSILNLDISSLSMERINSFCKKFKPTKYHHYGIGNSSSKFLKILKQKSFWNTSKQKYYFEKK